MSPLSAPAPAPGPRAPGRLRRSEPSSAASTRTCRAASIHGLYRPQREGPRGLIAAFREYVERVMGMERRTKAGATRARQNPSSPGVLSALQSCSRAWSGSVPGRGCCAGPGVFSTRQGLAGRCRSGRHGLPPQGSAEEPSARGDGSVSSPRT